MAGPATGAEDREKEPSSTRLSDPGLPSSDTPSEYSDWTCALGAQGKEALNTATQSNCAESARFILAGVSSV